MNNIIITIKKELRSIFRDKKTLATLFIYPIMIPLMIVLYGTIYENVDTDNTDVTIGINYSINEKEKNILEDLKINYITYDNFDDMQKAYEDKTIDAYVSYDDSKTQYTVYSSTSSAEGLSVNAIIYQYLETYSQNLTNEYLINKNIDLNEAYNHFSIESIELGNNNYAVTIVLSICLTYIILSICIGTSNMAISTSASEKENGTLETILTFPIKKTELILGKYFSSVVVGFVAGLMSLTFMIVGLYIAKNYYTIFESFELVLNIKSILGSLITILSAAIFISGIALILTAFAKTYKEAQSQVSMITIIAMIPMFISILGLNIDTYYYLIPICNFEQILNDLFTNNLTLTNTFITLGSSIVYIIVVIIYIIKAYNSEKILFNN